MNEVKYKSHDIHTLISYASNPTMVQTIRLKINGTETDLPWSEFVANIDSSETAVKLYEHFDTAFILQCSTLLFLMQVGNVIFCGLNKIPELSYSDSYS